MSRRAKRPMADHRAAAQALRDQPGVWLPVGDYRSRISADSLTVTIRYGYPIGNGCHAPYAPAGAFETRIELIDDFTRVHARYIGEEATR